MLSKNLRKSFYLWAVVGAGPAGIAAVGKLLDHGISEHDIIWIDPEFKVGDFGTKWKYVSSNTRVKLFTQFYHACHAFQFSSAPSHFDIHHANTDETCLLSLASQPLQWITDHLKNSIHTCMNSVSKIKLIDDHWELMLSNAQVQLNNSSKETHGNTKIRGKNCEKTHENTTSIIHAKNVILATGAEPKSLHFPHIPNIQTKEIALDIALNPSQLANICQPQDTIAVFGSSHSAIIIIKTLLEDCNINKVINFYLHPLRYAVYYDDWILFDDTGLKGKTAEWARKNIHDGNDVTANNSSNPTNSPNSPNSHYHIPSHDKPHRDKSHFNKSPHDHDKLHRILSHDQEIQNLLPQCDKIIYATGFKKREIMIEGIPSLEHNNQNGIIAPGLFGLGIGFPEAKQNRLGIIEHRVGLWKFMEYLQQIMPIWLRQ